MATHSIGLRTMAEPTPKIVNVTGKPLTRKELFWSIVDMPEAGKAQKGTYGSKRRANNRKQTPDEGHYLIF